MKLLITDLDGTLLTRAGAVHEDDLKAARALLAHGVHLSVATGRLYSGTRMHSQAIGVQGPVGCADGSQLVDARDHRALAVHPLPPETVAWLLAVEGVPYVFAEDSVHHDPRGEAHLVYVKTWSEQLVVHRDLGAVAWGPAKVVVLVGKHGPLQAAHERAKAEGLTAICFPFGDGLGLVVRRGGIDKGTAIEFIAAHHGVALADVAVVGDWLNDVPMLKRAGHRFVMGHASDEVKAHAHHVLPPGQSPLAHIAAHFGVKP
ncbi:MAG: HAD hydrolase family protein [Myxococcaceae bacterium]|nr:HAD hydrolase family protein [Myxococcaceae bacterium]